MTNYEQVPQDEHELNAEIEDSSERSQKIGQETIKSHEQLVDEEPIPEMAMIKAGRAENKAQARMDFTHLNRLKNKLESGEPFTLEDLEFIYEKDRPIERAESIDVTSAIVDLRGNVRKMLENGAKLEDVMSVMSFREKVLNINILIDFNLNPDEAIDLICWLPDKQKLEPYEQYSLGHFIERGLDVFDRFADILHRVSVEEIIEYYDVLTDPNNDKAYSPDTIINAFSADAIIEHIDFVRRIKPDFDPKFILQGKGHKFSPSKIAALIDCGLKPEQLVIHIDYNEITPEQLGMLLSNEESMKEFINVYYSDDYPNELRLFETVFNLIPDEQLEKYVSMLGLETYLRKYKYLQSRGLKMTPKRGDEIVQAIIADAEYNSYDDLGIYIDAMDDLAELREQGALKIKNFKMAGLVKELLKSYTTPCLDYIDTIARHSGDIDMRQTVIDLIQRRKYAPEMILRNVEKLLNVLGENYDNVFDSYVDVRQLIGYSIGDEQDGPCHTFHGEAADGLAKLIKTLDARAEAAGLSKIKSLIDFNHIRPDAIAYNLEIFLSNGIKVDLDWLLDALQDNPLAVLDNYETLTEHGAKIDLKQLINDIIQRDNYEYTKIEIYDKIVALDPGALDATTALAVAVSGGSLTVMNDLEEWQKRGADLNKAIAVCYELERVEVNDKINHVIKLLELGVDPSLIASKLPTGVLIKRDALEPLLRAGASIDFNRLLKLIEAETLKEKESPQDYSAKDRMGIRRINLINNGIVTLAESMIDVTPLVKAICDPKTLEYHKERLTAFGAKL